MGEKRTIEGELYHELEEFGGQTYEHLGFRDKDNKFGDMLAEIVPKVGMKKRVRLTMEILDNKIRIACASDDGINFTKEHFGSAKMFLIYEYDLDSGDFHLIEKIENTSPEEKSHGDPEKAKGVSELLKDVGVLMNLVFGQNISRMKENFLVVVSRVEGIEEALKEMGKIRGEIKERVDKKGILYLDDSESL